jgi:hypothetical protein
MTGRPSIVEFLRARLDEDQRYASYGGPTTSWAPRLLAEVKAKRRIVEMWEDPAAVRILPDGVRDGRDPDEVEIQVGIAEAIDDVVCVLAMPYAGHPDYDQAWAPEQVAT